MLLMGPPGAGRLFPVMLFAMLLCAGFIHGSVWAADSDIVAAALHDLEAGDTHSARARLDTAIASGKLPDDRLAIAFHARGEMSRRVLKLKLAMEDFTQSIRLRGWSASYLARAWCYEGLGEIENELDDLGAVLATDKANLDALNMRSEALFLIGKFEQSGADLATALQADPRNLRALGNRARLATNQKRFADARTDIDRAVRISPSDPTIQLRLGQLREGEGRASDALAVYDSALRAHPQDIDLLLARLEILREDGQFDRGEMDCQTLLSLRNGQAMPKVQIVAPLACGILAARMGRFPDANSYLDSSVSASPKPNSSILLARGLIRALSGRSADALADFDQGLALDPASATGHLHRGILRRSIGRSKEAADDLEIAIANGSGSVRGGGILWLALLDQPRASRLGSRYVSSLSLEERNIWPWSIVNITDAVRLKTQAASILDRDTPSQMNFHKTCSLPFYTSLLESGPSSLPSYNGNSYVATMRALVNVCPPLTVESLGARLEATSVR